MKRFLEEKRQRKDYASLSSLAISFFVVGLIVAVAWLAYLSVAIGEGPQPVMAMRISFPGMYVHWPGLPKQGVTGSMIAVD
jgi:hypothetical protein